MKENFEKFFQFTLSQEVEPGHEEDGSYHVDPRDPGGATKFGISQRAWPKLNIEHLTKEMAKSCYKWYWDQIEADKLIWPIDLCAADFAFNSGIQVAKEFTQKYKVDWKMFLLGRIFYYRKVYDERKVADHLRDWLVRVQNLVKFIGNNS